MAEIDSLNDLIVWELAQTYAAEQQVDQAVPDLVDRISSPDLQLDFQEMRATAERQQERLEYVFRLLTREPEARGSAVAEAILDGMEAIARWQDDEYVRDAALVAAAQQYVHYLIASYGTVRAHAQTIGLTEAASILRQCVQDEARLDELLTRRAEAEVNVKASRHVMAR